MYCKRIRKEIELSQNNLPESCKYFIVRNGKPVCKKVLFGKKGFILPTPTSIGKLMFRTTIEPFITFSGLIFGKLLLPSWWCLLMTDDDKSSRTMEKIGNSISLIDSDITDLIDEIIEDKD